MILALARACDKNHAMETIFVRERTTVIRNDASKVDTYTNYKQKQNKTTASDSRFSSSTYLISVSRPEDVDYFLEVVTHFFPRFIVGVTAGIDRVDTGSMGGPFMFPETLVALIVALPVFIHEG